MALMTHFGTCCPHATASLLRAWMLFMYRLITWENSDGQFGDFGHLFGR